jgi:hypothetical protein
MQLHLQVYFLIVNDSQLPQDLNQIITFVHIALIPLLSCNRKV